jgi:hypothetical protein
MSQPASDLPRFVQIIGRYRTLVGVMAALGLLAGAVFAALNPPVFTSQALILFTPSCPAGAICGGPLFVSDNIGPRLLPPLPSGVQVEPLAGNVQSVSATAGTAAQAEATANAAARSYLIYYDALIYSSGQASMPVLHPATGASGTAPLMRLRDDALLGAVLGALLGVIAALAGGAASIDTPAAPPGFDVGEGIGTSRPETSYATTGASLQQLALDYRRLPIASLTLPFARDRITGRSIGGSWGIPPGSYRWPARPYKSSRVNVPIASSSPSGRPIGSPPSAIHTWQKPSSRALKADASTAGSPGKAWPASRSRSRCRRMVASPACRIAARLSANAGSTWAASPSARISGGCAR